MDVTCFMTLTNAITDDRDNMWQWFESTPQSTTCPTSVSVTTVSEQRVLAQFQLLFSDLRHHFFVKTVTAKMTQLPSTITVITTTSTAAAAQHQFCCYMSNHLQLCSIDNFNSINIQSNITKQHSYLQHTAAYHLHRQMVRQAANAVEDLSSLETCTWRNYTTYKCTPERHYAAVACNSYKYSFVNTESIHCMWVAKARGGVGGA